ncbi:MAG: cation:proton antiporter [Elusimicrobiota bacterium]|jgi:Kef-type K+ transport system membrane component KefB|nr:cation:proton antiporter [Elusimicrobiota bacterium]
MEEASIFSFLVTFGVILVAAKIFGEIAVKFGQSAIIGELIAGVIIGPSLLGLVHETVTFKEIAELGAVILLFEAGLSTNIKEFAKAGGWATLVAFMGVVFPFLFGFFVFQAFGMTTNASIFAGAVLTATSVGITARVFLDLNKMDTQEAKIVLGAAVIDDVIGLVILAVVMQLVSGTAVSFTTILGTSGTAILFLAAVVGLGLLITPHVFKFVEKMNQDFVVFVIGIAFCLFVSALAAHPSIGLAPIVGAFAAGLVLSATKHGPKISEGVKPLYAFLVPLFFVFMGTKVDVGIFSSGEVLKLAAILFVVAFVGKALAGFVVLKKGIDKLLIGVAMVPRGEVGLIFASMGLTLGVFEQNIYSALVVVIMLTTFVTPVILKILIARSNKALSNKR